MDNDRLPPSSPDLNPCDSFLWGHLKQFVFNPSPKTIDDFKANPERDINFFLIICADGVRIELNKIIIIII